MSEPLIAVVSLVLLALVLVLHVQQTSDIVEARSECRSLQLKMSDVQRDLIAQRQVLVAIADAVPAKKEE